jgi:hypothetical protein
MAFYPDNIETRTVPAGGGKTSGSFVDAPGRATPGVWLNVSFDVANSDLVLPHDFDLRLAREEAFASLRLQHFTKMPFNHNRCDSIMYDAVLKQWGPAEWMESDAENLQTIGAGLTVAVQFVIPLMISDFRQNDGKDGMVPVDMLQDWAVDIGNMNQGANLTVASAIDIDVIVLQTPELDSVPVGAPSYLVDGDITDGLEHYNSEEWIVDIALLGPVGSIAVDSLENYSVAINSAQIISEVEGQTNTRVAQIGTDPDFIKSLQRSIILKTESNGYTLADLQEDCDITVQKRSGGPYSADMRILYTGKLKREVKTDKAIVNYAEDNNALVSASTVSGNKATSLIPMHLRSAMPLKISSQMKGIKITENMKSKRK